MNGQDAPAIRTAGLGKRHGSLWALQDCSVSVPRGRVSALVGPNGAGKTTLLKILAGLSAPSAGEAAVLGRAPGQSAEFLDSVGYLAQDVPLYKRLSAGDHLEIGAHLNRHWDATAARARLAALKIPLGQPVAALDPLARREFLTSLTEAAADGDLSVILSSHLLHDLERVCDHIILLAASRTRISDDIDNILEVHRMLVGPRRKTADAERSLDVIKTTQTTNQTRLLARLNGPVLDPSWEITEVGLEDIVLAYMGQDDTLTAGPLTQIGPVR